jgi:long-subunit acyl-CoA synthetase (AMP-forming)
MLPSLLLGIMGRGLVPVAILSSASASEVRHACELPQSASLDIGCDGLVLIQSSTVNLVAPEGPKVIFVHPSLLAIAKQVIEELSLAISPQLVLVARPPDCKLELVDLDYLIKAGQKHPQPIAELRRPAKELLGAIHFSSGTTGPPKAVQTSHLQLLAATRVCISATPYLFQPDGCLLSFLPLALGYGQVS